jgi:hypothetical protein
MERPFERGNENTNSIKAGKPLGQYLLLASHKRLFHWIKYILVIY